MYLLGYDIGSSSVKASIVDAQSGESLALCQAPKTEAPIISARPLWAEQNPQDWWEYLKQATAEALSVSGIDPSGIAAIGISYQMHGLVLIDKDRKVLRPAIIWCDSRAVPYGKRCLERLGADFCTQHLLNSPGNFTAAKLAWVKDNEPDIYGKVWKAMLPGDYIAMRLTGEVSTTREGLSEGILWDFRRDEISHEVLQAMGIEEKLIPTATDNIAFQGKLTNHAGTELGLPAGIPLTYRAGDQSNNAASLNVFNPGEVAATAGTSGVVYAVSDSLACDPLSRVNVFAHVNHSHLKRRLGVMLCINGTGIFNSWLRHTLLSDSLSYTQMNALAQSVPVGCDGLSAIPFGNGVERVLENTTPGASFAGLDFNRHSAAHIARSVQEGIAFSFRYGMDIMKSLGVETKLIRAGLANMFQSETFCSALAGISGSSIELMQTDGSAGAARTAGIGAGIYRDNKEAFSSVRTLKKIEPDTTLASQYAQAYELWLERLNSAMKSTKTQ